MIIPRMDNAELITAMAATLTLADVPMVIMSSLPEAEMASRCKGYRAFVRKPFRIAEVTRLVVEMLGERRMSTKISISASLCRPARDDRRTSGGGVLSAVVLTGGISGLLSRGASPLAAVGWGVSLQGQDRRRVATTRGPIGFLARELPAEFPRRLPQ
jgi:CheY-like chemotaxis protein